MELSTQVNGGTCLLCGDAFKGKGFQILGYTTGRSMTLCSACLSELIATREVRDVLTAAFEQAYSRRRVKQLEADLPHFWEGNIKDARRTDY
jgi:hypothetical protein